MNVTVQPYRPDDLVGIVEVLAEALPDDPIPPARFTRQILLDAPRTGRPTR